MLLSPDVFQKVVVLVEPGLESLDLVDGGGEEVHEVVDGLLAGQHAVDVVAVQHAQLTRQPDKHCENQLERILLIIK